MKVDIDVEDSRRVTRAHLQMQRMTIKVEKRVVKGSTAYWLMCVDAAMYTLDSLSDFNGSFLRVTDSDPSFNSDTHIRLVTL